MSEAFVKMMSNTRYALVQLRGELEGFMDITENGGPNEAMRLVREITVELGECEYERPSGKHVIMQGLLDDALDFCNAQLAR